MTDKHFTLDIHPGELRSAATQVADLHEQLGTLRTSTGSTPGEIGDAWTGRAADSLKSEMTHLGQVLGTFATKLDGVPAALRSLAKDYDDALAQLPGLNQRWDAAEQAYQDAVGAADTQRAQARQDLADSGHHNRAFTQEIDDAHSNAIGAAASTKQTTQHGLETSFGYLRQWLGQQTRALGDTLHDAGPVNVSDDVVAKWNAGQSPKVDVSSITAQLSLAKQNLDEMERLADAPEVAAAIARLKDALDNDTYESDPQEIQAALDEIAAHAGDPIWTKELVDQLKADGIQDIYKAIDRDMQLTEYSYEDLAASLSGFSDAVAQGISAHDDPEFAAIAQDFIKDGVAGEKIWGLITASDNADKRMNSVALAYHDQIENYTGLDGAQSSYPGLFPRALSDAYDGKALEHLLAHADGEALADVLEHCDPEFVDNLGWRLTNVFNGGSGFPTTSEEDFTKIAKVWLDAIDTMRDHFHDAQAAGDDYALGPLVALLKSRNLNQWPYADLLENGHLKDIVTDGELMAQLLDDANSGSITASDLKDMIEDSGVKPQDIMDAVVDYRLNHNDDPESAADNLGHLLRDADIIGDGFKPSVAIDSILSSLLSAGVSATKNPLTGPLVDLIKALLGEQARLDKLDKDWDDATAKNGPQQVLAFALYVKYYGTPTGFDDYKANHAGTVTAPDDIINHFLDRMQEDRNKSAQQQEEWENMERLIEAIDETRDEQ